MSEVAQAIHSSPDGHIPQLRFPEFSGEWMTDELSNLIEISSNKFNPNTSNESKKCIELEHLSQETGELLGYTDSTAQASTKNAFTKGQVLFGKLRPYLKKFWLSQFDGVCSSEIWVLNGKKLANNYLFQFIQTNKFNQIANVSSGSKMPRSDWKYMVQVPFKYTTKPEQQKIAAFLTAVDNKIEQLSKKQALLGEYKKCLMQKIFSQAIRFKADDGSDFSDWEQVKLATLSKLVTKQTGYDYSSTIKPSLETSKDDSNIPFVQNKDFNSTSINLNTDFYVPVSVQKKYPRITLDEKCLLITISGNIGNVGVYNKQEKAFIGGAVCVAKFKDKDNIDFVKYYLTTDIGQKMMLREVKASSHQNITVEGIRNFRIMLPYLEEQKKIVVFLSIIDNKIEQAGKQLIESKQFKKALLQQMFV